MSVRATVIAAMEQVAAERNKTLASLDDDRVLVESGLDSLCFAILVAQLDMQLDVDPFTTSKEIVFPVTVGDFVSFYERALVDAAA